MAIHRTANGHYGAGCTYNPHTMSKYKRIQALDKLNAHLDVCDKMLSRQTRKLNPDMKRIMVYAAKRQRIMSEIRKIERI